MRIKFTKIIITSLLFVLAICTPTHAKSPLNPYNLFGNGNCALFAWEIMDMYYPVSFNIPGKYDAKDWVKLDGQKRNGYELKLYNEPSAGDFLIFSADVKGQSSYRGHVAFIKSVEEKIVLNFQSKKAQKEIWINIIESSDYAEREYYPFIYEGCYFGYRKILFERDGEKLFDERDIKFLKLINNQS